MTDVLVRFYKASEKEKRKAWLEKVKKEGCADLPSETITELQKVWELRYPPKKHLWSAEQDLFLLSVMDLMYIGKEYKRGHFGSKLQKELVRIVSALGLSCGQALNLPSGQDSKPGLGSDQEVSPYLYAEYKNALQLFLELGKTDQSYSRGLFQLRELKPEALTEKIKKDYTILSQVLLELDPQLKPFSLAAAEVLKEYLEGLRQRESGDGMDLI